MYGDQQAAVHSLSMAIFLAAGGRLNIKMSSYQYRDSHVKDKTVSPTVSSLTWEFPYLGKTVLMLRPPPLGASAATRSSINTSIILQYLAGPYYLGQPSYTISTLDNAVSSMIAVWDGSKKVLDGTSSSTSHIKSWCHKDFTSYIIIISM